MSGPNHAEAQFEPVQDGNAEQDAQADEDLARSRRGLEDLAERLRTLDEKAEVEEQYWLYEHLRQLSTEANDLLEEFEGQLQPPLYFESFVEELIKPLEKIYDDLRTYYWKPRCLLEKLAAREAASEVDQVLLRTTREVRKEWGLFASAIREYVIARQDQEAPERPLSLLATSEAFYLKFQTFVRLLSGLVENETFVREHSRWATRLKLPP